MSETYPLTPEGHRRMKEELQRLKNVERPKISLEIGAARELGDLSENFEYHAAKDRQGLIEARVRDLESKLSRAEVIDPTKLRGTRVVFGATVELLDVESDEHITYQLVGEEESDLKAGRISVQSPLARALIGKEEGEEAKIPGRGGPRTVEVSAVRFV